MILDAAEESDGSAPPVRVPPWCIHAGPVVGALNGVLGTRMFPVNAEMARLSTTEMFYSSAKAERELDYDWRPLRGHATSALEWWNDRTESEPATGSADEGRETLGVDA